jgi:uncharacterized delta-60 repeat protein
MERRVLLSSIPIALDPTFGAGGKVLNTQSSLGLGIATAYNAASHDLIVAGELDFMSSTTPLELQAYTSTGALDTAFGSGGTAVSTVIGTPTRLAIGADGKIIVVSRTSSNSSLSRYTSVGSMDASFGSGGSVLINSATFVPNPDSNIRLLANGDLVLAGWVGSGSATKAALVAYTKAGKLDPSFGTGGVALGIAGSFSDVAVDSAGRLVAVGATSPTASTPPGEFSAGLVERFTASGALDLSFDAGAPVIVSSVTDFAGAMGLSNGGVAVYGKAVNFTQDTATSALYHFTASGALDLAYGPGGKGFAPINSNIFPAQVQPTFQPDGKLLIAGSIITGNGASSVAAVARVNIDGSLDSGFGSGGYANLGAIYGANPAAGGISLQPDGKIILGHNLSNSDIPLLGFDFSPTRLNANGTPDTTFGPAGTALSRPIFASGQAIAQLPNGQTLVAGQLTFGGQMGLYVRRYNANGSLDSSFAHGDGFAGQSGYAFVGPAVGATIGSTNAPSAVGLAVDAQGRILVGDSAVGLLRLTSSGGVDTTFGAHGTAAIGKLGNFLLQANGQILASSANSVMTRLTKNGQPDLSFGGDGNVSVPIFFIADAPMAVQADGKILVGGSMIVEVPFGQGFLSNTDLAVARLKNDGSLDTTFGSGGIATADFFQFDGGISGSTNAANATALAVLPNGNIVAAGVTQQENTSLYGENEGTLVEFLPTGKPNLSFGSAGEVQPYFGDATDVTVTNLFAQSDGRLVLTGTVESNGPASFYVRRYSATGALTDYVTTQFPVAGNNVTITDRLLDAAVSVNRKLVVVGSATGLNGPTFGLARYLLQAGSISGTLFNDLNANGNPEGNEPKLQGRSVFIDANNNGKLDVGESKTATDASGRFTFTNLQAGTYFIRQVLPAGWRQTAPSGNTAARVVSLGVGQDATVMQIGATQAAVITGKSFNDANSNGIFDAGEAGLANWQVYIDKNNNGVWDKGEFIVNSDSQGNYTMVINPGAYRLREVRQDGWTRTQPSGDWPLGYYDVTVGAGQLVASRNFGNNAPITFVSQQRTLSSQWGLDSEYSSGGGGTHIGGDGPQGDVANGFGQFNSYSEDGFKTGPITVPIDPAVHYINVDGKATQNSILSVSSISDSGTVSASEADDGGSAGSSYASAESYFQTTFRVGAAVKYSLAAQLSIASGFGSALTLTLVGPSGTQVIVPQNVSGTGGATDNFTRSGTLAVGTYTLTLDASARDQTDNFPSGSYSLSLKFG